MFLGLSTAVGWGELAVFSKHRVFPSLKENGNDQSPHLLNDLTHWLSPVREGQPSPPLFVCFVVAPRERWLFSKSGCLEVIYLNIDLPFRMKSCRHWIPGTQISIFIKIVMQWDFNYLAFELLFPFVHRPASHNNFHCFTHLGVGNIPMNSFVFELQQFDLKNISMKLKQFLPVCLWRSFNW